MSTKLLLVLLVSFPLTCWAFIKPIRVLKPEWNGLTCVTNDICVEDISSTGLARDLYEEAFNFAIQKIGTIEKHPKVCFCLTDNCFRSFGFHSPAKAKAIGTFGIIVGPDGWRNYILRHEFIHHIQAEQLGIIQQWTMDDWLKEGMAYSMSEDPRKLTDFRRKHIEKFESWYSSISQKEFWAEAKRL